MVDSTCHNETSLVAIQLGCLKNRTHRLTVGKNTESTIIGLEAAGQGCAGGTRVGDEVVGRLGTSQANRL
jgi:hypothetical protein